MLTVLGRANALAAVASRPFEAVLLLAMRLYVSWQFLISGWLKLQDWESTLFLFREEYHVPVLPPATAAVFGTAVELLFPLLLIVGLLTRYAALGLALVNVMAVVSYAHVLLAAGFEAAIGQHCLWGTLLLVILVFGPGRFAVDSLVERARR